jgi:hypothetical protein
LKIFLGNMRCKRINYLSSLQILPHNDGEKNMKRTVLVTLMLLSCIYAAATDTGTISGAFKNGKADGLLPLMEKEIDLAVSGSSCKCSASESVSRLNVFFNANRPTAFSILHTAEKNGSGFMVGKLSTCSGSFRVNITYRVEADKAVIQSIRIE